MMLIMIVKYSQRLDSSKLQQLIEYFSAVFSNNFRGRLLARRELKEPTSSGEYTLSESEEI